MTNGVKSPGFSSDRQPCKVPPGSIVWGPPAHGLDCEHGQLGEAQTLPRANTELCRQPRAKGTRSVCSQSQDFSSLLILLLSLIYW